MMECCFKRTATEQRGGGGRRLKSPRVFAKHYGISQCLFALSLTYLGDVIIGDMKHDTDTHTHTRDFEVEVQSRVDACHTHTPQKTPKVKGRKPSLPEPSCGQQRLPILGNNYMGVRTTGGQNQIT